MYRKDKPTPKKLNYADDTEFVIHRVWITIPRGTPPCHAPVPRGQKLPASPMVSCDLNCMAAELLFTPNCLTSSS